MPVSLPSYAACESAFHSPSTPSTSPHEHVAWSTRSSVYRHHAYTPASWARSDVGISRAASQNDFPCRARYASHSALRGGGTMSGAATKIGAADVAAEVAVI